ncbi:serine/threonine-protein kinase SBK1-like [Leptodactylus fuscus]|uniref:serine/threonine-protein kinase SBK1-like n=1 Tax=Leptodactylus fuscus TaxID=238119 RepID=UPI003F4EBC5B
MSPGTVGRTFHHVNYSHNGSRLQDISQVFRIIKTLGQGSYGQVVLAEDTTGTLLAAKLQRKERTDRNLFLSELSLSVRLSEHPSIIRTHPIFIETPEHYILTQELAPSGTMHELIKDQLGMPEDRLKRCAVQISSALLFMHMRGLVHRDLKPDNVFLMDPECHLIKLGDFGLTRYAGSLVPMTSHIIPFMAPEICNLKSGEYLYLSASVDTWAFGVLLFVALTGYYPWEGATEEDSMIILLGPTISCLQCHKDADLQLCLECFPNSFSFYHVIKSLQDISQVTMEETPESQKTGDDVQMLKNLGKEDLWSHHHVLKYPSTGFPSDLLESVEKPGRSNFLSSL